MTATKELQVIEGGNGIVTPMDMLGRAVASGASLDVLEKLMALQERWEANEARRAFDEAMSAAKAELSPVIRNRTGHNSKKYADFAAIARAVDPIIAKHGLSYRFRTSQDDRIHVTCIVSHRAGHSEENTLSGPADKTGSKNDIQAIGSTLTYLQRYSLAQALGIAAADDDDGGAADNGEKIAPDQIAWLQTCIVEAGADIQRFLKYMSRLAKMDISRLDDIPARLYSQAIDALNKKRSEAAQ